MNKSNKVFLLVIIILLVALIVMTFLYLNMRNIAKENLNQVLESAELNSKLNAEISELKEKNNGIENVTNTTNMTVPNTNVVINNTRQNEVPKESEISVEKDYSIDIDKVTIKVDESTISSKSISIIITNDNENELTYGEEFKIEKKIDGEWKTLEYLPNTVWNAMAYITKGNSQTNKKLNIENYYGELENGTYRVIKPVFGGNIYSDEFEIG